MNTIRLETGEALALLIGARRFVVAVADNGAVHFAGPQGAYKAPWDDSPSEVFPVIENHEAFCDRGQQAEAVRAACDADQIEPEPVHRTAEDVVFWLAEMARRERDPRLIGILALRLAYPRAGLRELAAGTRISKTQFNDLQNRLRRYLPAELIHGAQNGKAVRQRDRREREANRTTVTTT